MDGEELLRKKKRIRQQQKKRFAKSSGTLAGQAARIRTAKGYVRGGKIKLKIKFD